MNDIDTNDAVATYEAHLRDAERSIEKALQAICCLTGEDVAASRLRVNFTVLSNIQTAIRETYKLYV